MATGKEEKAKFVFAPINGEGGDAASRKSVRAHAMNESLRQRLAGIKLSSSDEQLPYQTGRFRVSASPSKIETKLTKVESGRKPRKLKPDATRELADTETCLDQKNSIQRGAYGFTNIVCLLFRLLEKSIPSMSSQSNLSKDSR